MLGSGAPVNPIGILASCVGKGLFAGAVGTAAMPASNTIEMKLSGREPSKTPALAVCKALDIELKEEQQKLTFANVIHWQYGTGWGSVRGMIDVVGLRGLPATLTFLAAVWGTELVMLPAMGVTQPATKWSSREIGIDALHHVVYAFATSLEFSWMEA